MIAGRVAGERHERRAGGHPAEPEVRRDHPAPHGCVDERTADIGDRRVAHPAVRLGDLPRRGLGVGVAGVASLVQIRPLGIAEVRAGEADRLARLGRGPRGRSAAAAQRGPDVAATGVVVAHPLGRACAGAVGRLLLGAHQVPPRVVVRPRRAAVTNARTVPAPASEAGRDRGQRGRDDVLLHRRVGVRGQAVALGRLGQQEERAEAAGELVFGLVAGAVQVRALDPARMQLGHPARGDLHQLLVGAELDRVGRAGLRAGRLQSVLQAVITERALPCPPVDGVAVDHAERTRGHAVATPVAHVRLEHHRLMLGSDQRAGGARIEATRVGAVTADVGHEHPIAQFVRPFAHVDRARRRDRRQVAARAVRQRALGLLPELRRGLEQLDEPDVAPRRRREVPGVVIGDALTGLRAVRGQVVPLLARDLAGLAADAHRRVGEEAHPLRAHPMDRDLGLWGARAHRFACLGFSAGGSSSFGAT